MRIKTPDKHSRYLAVKRGATGRGVFAKKSFKKDEIIFEIYGTLLTCNEDDELEDRIRSNTIRYSKEYFLSPQNELGDYLNHSCSPNAYMYKRNSKIYLRGIEEIEKGIEIVIDYSTILASDDIWEMNCACKNPNCRKIIRSFDKLPQKLRDLYLSRKLVPSYIYNHGR